jgi:hypothetical protein
MIATKKIVSTGGKNITKIGIIIVEVPNPVIVPMMLAKRVSKVM